MSKELKRKLRANSTGPERALWRLLWPLRTGGYHFRKQVEIGAYYVDFACLHAQLVIEIDGDSHAGSIAQANDATRDDYLKARGFKVLRISNDEVLGNPEGVFASIASALDFEPDIVQAGPPPQSSPQGGGCQTQFAAGSEDNK